MNTCEVLRRVVKGILLDSKSGSRKGVPVRPRLRAPGRFSAAYALRVGLREAASLTIRSIRPLKMKAWMGYRAYQ